MHTYLIRTDYGRKIDKNCLPTYVPLVNLSMNSPPNAYIAYKLVVLTTYLSNEPFRELSNWLDMIVGWNVNSTLGSSGLASSLPNIKTLCVLDEM